MPSDLPALVVTPGSPASSPLDPAGVSNRPPAPRGVVIGRLVSVDADGRLWLSLPLPGREMTWAACCLCQPSDLTPGVRVAVLFQEGNADLAVVVGPVVAEFEAAPGGRPQVLAFEAEQQISLRCGPALLRLLRDGTVQIRGTDVHSRAMRTQRIRGANVQIN